MDERRRQYLEAMGIQLWVPREPVPEEGPAPAEVVAAAAEEREGGTTLSESHDAVPAVVPAPREVAAATPAPEPGVAGAGNPDDCAGADWEGLKTLVDRCRRCPELVANRTQTVFGVGNREARWMVIGEAPGADEDRLGEPFVGRAGQLLNEMLRAVGLAREEVYIANVLKSRPPNNRDPKPEEVANCEGYLKRQIELVAPRIILAIGRISAQNLLKSDTPIGKLRGKLHDLNGTPLVVTYHPAYLLRSPLEKRKAWDDLRFALKVYRETAGP